MLGEQLSVQGVWGSLLSPFQSFSALPQPPAALLSLLVALTQTCPVFLKEGGTAGLRSQLGVCQQLSCLARCPQEGSVLHGHHRHPYAIRCEEESCTRCQNGETWGKQPAACREDGLWGFCFVCVPLCVWCLLTPIFYQYGNPLVIPWPRTAVPSLSPQPVLEDFPSGQWIARPEVPCSFLEQNK